eukprot:TRINITY_DN22739_c0_g2_i4.p1 TRINITY_DN22739_c0_g2~~TRINITY_DN22739_c0_g2_i4.p1  ORF type:complete len:204 (+),score=8.51 TRINITY_DN22739_c0_g2_i4:77-688(+)
MYSQKIQQQIFLIPFLFILYFFYNTTYYRMYILFCITIWRLKLQFGQFFKIDIQKQQKINKHKIIIIIYRQRLFLKVLIIFFYCTTSCYCYYLCFVGFFFFFFFYVWLLGCGSVVLVFFFFGFVGFFFFYEVGYFSVQKNIFKLHIWGTGCHRFSQVVFVNIFVRSRVIFSFVMATTTCVKTFRRSQIFILRKKRSVKRQLFY